LRGFQRGTLNARPTEIETPLDHPLLPNRQEWVLMDHRGNWEQIDESIGVPPVTVDEYRTVNVVNEQNGPHGGPYRICAASRAGQEPDLRSVRVERRRPGRAQRATELQNLHALRVFP